MKIFGTCSGCSQSHNWREIDYDNILYVSKDNAICLTLCPSCVVKFIETRQNKNTVSNYKQRIDSILNGKTKPVVDFTLTHQTSSPMFWGLSF